MKGKFSNLIFFIKNYLFVQRKKMKAYKQEISPTNN